MTTCQSFEDGTPSSRHNIRRPTAMIIGTDKNADLDVFTISQKFSRLQNRMVEVVTFVGYRHGHTTVQVGQHLYVLGGIDGKGNTMDRVSGMESNFALFYNIWCPPSSDRCSASTSAIGRSRRCHRCCMHEHISHLCISMAAFMRSAPTLMLHQQTKSYYQWNGTLFNAHFLSKMTKNNFLIHPRSYDLAKNQWSNESPMKMLSQSIRQMAAAAFENEIIVVYSGGMSVYKPHQRGWCVSKVEDIASEAHICLLSMDQSKLVVSYRFSDHSAYYFSEFMPTHNNWYNKTVRCILSASINSNRFSTIVFKFVSVSNLSVENILFLFPVTCRTHKAASRSNNHWLSSIKSASIIPSYLLTSNTQNTQKIVEIWIKKTKTASYSSSGFYCSYRSLQSPPSSSFKLLAKQKITPPKKRKQSTLFVNYNFNNKF